MAKKSKIIIVNFVLILLFLLIAETVVFLYEKIQTTAAMPFVLFKHKHSLNYYKNFFREPVGTEYNSEPIYLYGCSFAHGDFLEEKERPDYILSELTKRPVYNFSMGGKGIQHALFIMQNQEKVKPYPEYFIYICYSDQLRRLLEPCGVIDNENFLNFKIINNRIVFYPEKTDFLQNTYLYRKLLQMFLYHNQEILSSDKTFKTFELFIKQMNEEIHQNYPDSKFIFIFYDNSPFNKKQTEDLIKMENKQFKILNLPDILGDSFYENPKYKIPNDEHPSAAAWRVIIPEIIKYM